MNFNQALELLKNGKKIKRTDWYYPESAYVEVFSYGGLPITYICKSNNYNLGFVVSYNFTFEDTQSECWVSAD